MNIVIDSNIIMSILIKENGFTSKRFQLFADNHLLFIHKATIVEIEKHQQKLLKSSKLTIEDFEILKTKIFNQVAIIEKDEISLNVQSQAFLLVKDIDENDTAFVATTIYLNAILWSGDKPLFDGLRAKGFLNIYDSPAIQTLLL